MPISLPREASLAAHRLPPTNDPGVHPACPGRPRGRAGHAQPPPTTTARSKSTLGWPSTACASFERQAPTQADDEPGMDAAGDHADPGHPSRTAACPPPRSRTSLRPDTADAATHRHRTPTPDAGQRTPDSGHLDAQTPAPDTGHRTPDAGRGRGQVTTARPASGPPEPPRRATVRWDAQPCSCGRAPAALGSPCRLGGEAAFQREIASRRQLLGRSARVERRLGALLSSERIRVERRANGEASSVMTSARAGANWSVDGSVGEAVGRWSDWGGRGEDEQPSWSTLGCRGAMARSPRPLGRACRTASGRPSHRGRCNRRLLDVEPTA
jgi:hypothetical protein